MEEQDEAYRRDGVALPRSRQMDMADTFAKQVDGVMTTQNNVNCAGDGPDPGRLAKCRALSAAKASYSYLNEDRDGSLLPSGEKGYKHWHGDFPYGTNDPDCSYYVEYLEDVDGEKCGLNDSGVEAVLDDIADACKDHGVFVSVVVGGDCPVRFVMEKRSWPEGEAPPISPE
jgi:hypothetical protein